MTSFQMVKNGSMSKNEQFYLITAISNNQKTALRLNNKNPDQTFFKMNKCDTTALMVTKK